MNHNNNKMIEITSKSNPLACLKCQTIGCNGKFKRKHFDDSSPLKTYICVGYRVAIKGKKFQPTWGLYNGAIGTVIEIVFHEDKNPNFGHLPAYVSVEFPSYSPPPSIPQFHPENEKVSIILYTFNIYIMQSYSCILSNIYFR